MALSSPDALSTHGPGNSVPLVPDKRVLRHIKKHLQQIAILPSGGLTGSGEYLHVQISCFLHGVHILQGQQCSWEKPVSIHRIWQFCQESFTAMPQDDDHKCKAAMSTAARDSFPRFDLDDCQSMVNGLPQCGCHPHLHLFWVA